LGALHWLITCVGFVGGLTHEGGDAFAAMSDSRKKTLTDSLHYALNGFTKNPHLKGLLISNITTAVALAESVLFSVYGKKKIDAEKPYEIAFIENYWLINGHVPKNSKGGTFSIIINAKNGQVIKLMHGK
jgi:hypothetical protein